MAKPGKKGIERIIKATGYSIKGLIAAFKNEAAFRQELFAALILIPCALYLGQNNIEKAILISSVFLILITELLNSSIESLVDRVGSEHHELSGRAKDIGSAAVFIAIAQMVICWIIVLFT